MSYHFCREKYRLLVDSLWFASRRVIDRCFPPVASKDWCYGRGGNLGFHHHVYSNRASGSVHHSKLDAGRSMLLS